jgi:membrane associated rhomboid family serine protease
MYYLVLFLKGLLTRYYRLIALSLAIMIYGGMVWYVFPKVDNAISWEGHLGDLLQAPYLCTKQRNIQRL